MYWVRACAFALMKSSAWANATKYAAATEMVLLTCTHMHNAQECVPALTSQSEKPITAAWGARMFTRTSLLIDSNKEHVFWLVQHNTRWSQHSSSYTSFIIARGSDLIQQPLDNVQLPKTLFAACNSVETTRCLIDFVF